QIPFTDVPQGPVDGLSHEIAVIVRLSLDQRQHSPKLRVGRLLVPIRQVSHQCKPRPLDELWAAPAPGHRFPPCRSSEHEEMATRAVRSEEHTSELQSRFDLVCRLLLEKKNK